MIDVVTHYTWEIMCTWTVLHIVKEREKNPFNFD